MRMLIGFDESRLVVSNASIAVLVQNTCSIGCSVLEHPTISWTSSRSNPSFAYHQKSVGFEKKKERTTSRANLGCIQTLLHASSILDVTSWFCGRRESTHVQAFCRSDTSHCIQRSSIPPCVHTHKKKKKPIGFHVRVRPVIFFFGERERTIPIVTHRKCR